MLIGRRGFLKLAGISAGLGILGCGSNDLRNLNQAELSKSSEADITPFTFCVVSDPHSAEDAKEGIEKYGNGVEKFLACVREIEKLQGADRPDFMLITGDIHLWAIEEHLGKIKIPIHVVAGNHENKARKKEMRELFPADFKKGTEESDYYSFVHKGVRFIGLCDAVSGEHYGQFCSEEFVRSQQCEWLEKELAESENSKIIFAHIPPEPQGKDRIMYMSRNDSRYFNELIKETQPTAMFFGHHHRDTKESQVGRTKSYIMRSCCWNFAKGALGFMVVKVSAEGISTREIFTGSYS